MPTLPKTPPHLLPSSCSSRASSSGTVMSSVPVEALQGGLCYDLDPAVLDKYFMSDKRGGFENLTAKAICAHCPILQACLEQAIADPPAHGIRGGETSESIAALRYRHYRERTPIPVLARMAIRHQT